MKYYSTGTGVDTKTRKPIEGDAQGSDAGISGAKVAPSVTPDSPKAPKTKAPLSPEQVSSAYEEWYKQADPAILNNIEFDPYDFRNAIDAAAIRGESLSVEALNILAQQRIAVNSNPTVKGLAYIVNGLTYWVIGLFSFNRNVAEESLAVRNGTRQAAFDFYKAQGWAEDRINSHLDGIDFSKPVEVVILPKGTQVVQYQIPGNSMGNYFAPIGTSADALGINATGRKAIIYTTTRDISVLKTIAADTSGNQSIPSLARGSGGGTQFFASDLSAFGQ